MDMKWMMVSFMFSVTLKDVRGVKSHDVADICAWALTPTLPLTSETLILNFNASLSLTDACVIHITADDNVQSLQVSSEPNNLASVPFPCDWLSIYAYDDFFDAPIRTYACPRNLPELNWWMEEMEGHDALLIVNSTMGIERTGDFSLILYKFYSPCYNYSNNPATTYCCKHGPGESAADYAGCKYELPTRHGPTHASVTRCVPQNMVCDGVINRWCGGDEVGCDVGADVGGDGVKSGAVSGGGVVVVGVVGVGVVGVGVWVVM